MRALIRNWVVALLLVAAVPLQADSTFRIFFTQGMGDARYCLLAGCAITGTSSINANFTLGSAAKLQWGSSGVATPDTVLVREGANLLAQNNGVNAQTYRIYNTDDGAGNTERGVITWSGNVFVIQTAASGTGSARVMTVGPAGAAGFNVQTTGSPRLQFDAAGNASFAQLVRPDGSTFRVTADFTDASATTLQNITGLSWVLPASTAANYTFKCEILYSQATAAVADAFGIQSSVATTNIMAKGDVDISASTFAAGNIPTLNTTTATSIVAFTPSAITTVWNARLSGLIENPSVAANTINISVSQTTGANLITIKRGSYCVVGF